MATDDEKRKIRNAVERKATETGIPIRWVKDALNDATDDLDSFIQNAKPQIANVIDAATQPYGVTLTAQEKTWFTAIVLRRLLLRDA